MATQTVAFNVAQAPANPNPWHQPAAPAPAPAPAPAAAPARASNKENMGPAHAFIGRPSPSHPRPPLRPFNGYTTQRPSDEEPNWANGFSPAFGLPEDLVNDGTGGF
ncbi:hypothetical protein PYCCODRAFT_1455851 [Trametes coccinea BRFM310]|uniref:Uncharacterized protein n=1 Tax=Trametes coccinea (strain BRFM310) TaxID=1353009 RepID=A0A1Y2J347_TRAC3|nr:hypothetical protein PYCCODRAFT_1455851 [Trametes coccinea BRFM310]